MKLTRRQLIELGLLGALGLAAGLGFKNSRDLRLESTDIRVDRLPPVFDGLRIVQLTDIHAGRLTPTSLIRRGVDLALAARPDLVFLTGDFITGASLFAWGRLGTFDPSPLTDCLAELARLRAPLGVFAVLGNHDFWSGPQAVEAVDRGLRRIGARPLRNESARIEKEGQSLFLAGVDDYWSDAYDLEKSVRGLPAEACTVLLSHNPDVNRDVVLLNRRIDLIVSGHTHGGQVVLPLIGQPFMPSHFGQKYRVGLVRDPDRWTFVSRGLGVFFVPVRLNCPAEVNLITLRRA